MAQSLSTNVSWAVPRPRFFSICWQRLVMLAGLAAVWAAVCTAEPAFAQEISPARAKLVAQLEAKLKADAIKAFDNGKSLVEATRWADEAREKDAKYLAAIRDYVDGKLRKDIFLSYIGKVKPLQSSLLARPLEQAARKGDKWATFYLASAYLRPKLHENTGESLQSMALPKEAGWARDQAVKLATNPKFFRNRILGKKLLEESAGTLPRAKALLGYYLLYGYQIEYDPKRGMALVKEAADAGDALGLFALGAAYGNGLGVEKDPKKALAYFKKAGEELRYAAALSELGRIHFLGVGVEKDLEKAAEYYRQRALTQSAEGYRQFAVFCVMPGKGVKADVPKSFKLLEFASKMGNGAASGNLAYYYAFGKYVKKDIPTAIKWYQTAASQGHADSMYYLGLRYRDGNGVAKNDKLAYQWFRLANRARHVKATLEVARCYKLGRGVEKNTGRADYIYTTAAKIEAEDSNRQVQQLAKAYRAAKSVTQTEFINMIRKDPGVKVDFRMTSTAEKWIGKTAPRKAFENLVKNRGFKVNPKSPFILRCDLSVRSMETRIKRTSNQIGGNYTISNHTTPIIFEMSIIRELPVWDGKRFLPHEMRLVHQYGFSVYAYRDHPSKHLIRIPTKVINDTLSTHLKNWQTSMKDKPKLTDAQWRESYLPKLDDEALFRGYRAAEHLKDLYYLSMKRLVNGNTISLRVDANKTASQCISATKQLAAIRTSLKAIGIQEQANAPVDLYVNNLMVRSSGGKVFGFENNPTYVFLTTAMVGRKDDVIVPIKDKFVRLHTGVLETTLDCSIAKPNATCAPASQLSERQIAIMLGKLREASN